MTNSLCYPTLVGILSLLHVKARCECFHNWFCNFLAFGHSKNDGYPVNKQSKASARPYVFFLRYSIRSFFFKYLNDNLKKLYVFHHAKSTPLKLRDFDSVSKSCKFGKFWFQKLLAKFSGTFFIR